MSYDEGRISNLIDGGLQEQKKTEIIRTLGLYQPYAGLMLPPWNKVETRWVRIGRKPPFPLGTYLIYATQKVYSLKEFQSIAGEFGDIVLRDITYNGIFEVRGAAIGIGDLVKVERFNPIHQRETYVKWIGGDNSQTHTRWLLRFDNMRAIKPFTIKGKQGIGFLSEADLKKIEFIH